MRLSAVIAAGLSATMLAACATASPAPSSQNMTEDPYLWLEDVEGDQAIAWVREQNARSLPVLENDPRYAQLHADALTIANSRDPATRASSSATSRSRPANQGASWTSYADSPRHGQRSDPVAGSPAYPFRSCKRETASTRRREPARRMRTRSRSCPERRPTAAIFSCRISREPARCNRP